MRRPCIKQSNTSRKNSKNIYFILDLEADGGTLGHMNRTYESISRFLKNIPSYMTQDNGIKINAFVEGRLLADRPEIIEGLDKLNIEYFSHGYDHGSVNGTRQDKIKNIVDGINEYQTFFKTKPLCYRAPNGQITSDDIDCLKQNGIIADASITPCWFPGRFNHTRYQKKHFFHDNGLLEIPITTISPLEIPLGLGFAQLIGNNIFMQLLKFSSLPDHLFFYFHLHDFYPETVCSKKNKGMAASIGYFKNSLCNGFTLFEKIGNFFKQNGYCSDFLSNHILQKSEHDDK